MRIRNLVTIERPWHGPKLRRDVDELASVILQHYDREIGRGDPEHGESAPAVAARILSLFRKDLLRREAEASVALDPNNHTGVHTCHPCGDSLTDRNDEHRTFFCHKPECHTDEHRDGDCEWTDETHLTRLEEPEGMEGP